MSELVFSPVFQEISCGFKDQSFSAMYFGKHFGKNLVILKHNITMLLVFGDDIQRSTPEMIKTVSFRSDVAVKGVKIVGSDDVVLLLDESGMLWKLINAFDSFLKENECLHSLNDSWFYEWVPFKPFNFYKVLAVCATGRGFAFLALNRNNKKRLTVLHSFDSPLEDYTLEEVNTLNSFNFHLVSIQIKVENSVFENTFEGMEHLLITDRFTGRTYLVGKKGKNYLINQSNIRLISVLHYPRERALVLCYQNGKLVFYYYNKKPSHKVVYLSRKIIFVEKCFCNETCLLWSDGVGLLHTRLSFDSLKVCNLKVNFALQGPLSVLLIHDYALVVTMNNIYYLISAGLNRATEIQTPAEDLPSEFSKYTDMVVKYELKTEMLTHYLYCKDIVQNSEIKKKIEMKWEENHLIIKSFLKVCLRKDFWKVRLKASVAGMALVRTVALNCDLCEGMMIAVDNPFGCKCNARVSLVGDFEGECLFLDLGEVEGIKESFEKFQMKKQLVKIWKERNS